MQPYPRAAKGKPLEIEFVQDLAETKLMEAGHHSAARRFILYREERRKARALRGDRTIEGAPQVPNACDSPGKEPVSL